ncbi:LruC domain-containing protein [Emticicia sp. BO119]|uniref:LruC domain-containing protein n=1 Tax=Emticicia sp. BO119 TaxID=2757768 RepID=UPI0015F0BE30|nr:LruC domain-containing protein [Emticicia sp. BO119]MBA4849740.1 LruC domain-containing protein [Emticicia sp. BO119]
MKQTLTCLSVIFILLVNACAPKLTELMPESDQQGSSNTKMDKLAIPSNFNFNTSSEIKFDVRTLNNADKPIKGVVISVFSYPENKLLFKGASSSSGSLSFVQKIPTYITKVAIRPNYIGLPIEVVVEIVNNKVLLTLGGKEPQTSANVITSPLRTQELSGARAIAQDYPSFEYLGGWNALGVPKYLEKNRDEITSRFLDNINASLPEGDPLTRTHPSYLNTFNRNVLYIKELSDVWVTFVHEGADWLNTLGFYTFNPKTPPSEPSDISKITIVFPNVSYKGSGGGLVSGDKVKIGRFAAGTAIGFVLIADAYDNKSVTKGNYAHYSHDALNTETSKDVQRHLIVLNDLETKRMVLAFEDVNRQNKPFDCDNDFNDAIFFASSNPVSGIDADYIPLVDSKDDADKDGIEDSEDQYPNDATKTVSNFTPDKNGYSSLAFEDLWPFQGDYDMNDLVINYQFEEVLNASNQVVEIKAKAYVKAIGASFISGWGFELPVESSLIKSVTGTFLTEGKIKTLANGAEADQKYATIIAFDNAFKCVKSANGFVNTEQGAEIIAPADTLNMKIVFTKPIDKNTLGSAPYNPFIFKNDERGKEIHLPNKAPTSKADAALLGTGHDRSVPAKGTYYKTAKGLPWAIDFSSDFQYPAEREAVVDTYLKFGDWAESGGLNFADWYLLNLLFINESKVFKGKKK